MNRQERRHKQPVRTDPLANDLNQFSGRLKVRYHKRIETTGHRINLLHDALAAEKGARRFGINDRDDGNALFERADGCDLGQI